MCRVLALAAVVAVVAAREGDVKEKVHECIMRQRSRSEAKLPPDYFQGTFPLVNQVCHPLRLYSSEHGPVTAGHAPKQEQPFWGPGSLRPADLQALASSLKAQYQVAAPYKHTVIDNFLPDYLARRSSAEIEGYTGYKTRTTRFGMKGGLGGSRDMSPVGLATRDAVDFFQSPTFVDFLVELTGIKNLTIDESLWGAGPFAIDQNGFLSLHTDFNIHAPHGEPQTQYRRINVLVYLNEDWKEQHGGSFELWDTDEHYSYLDYYKKVVPTFNRMAVFSVNDISLHGHLDVVNHPRGLKRKSLSMYYYTPTVDDDPLLSPDVHSSIYISGFSRNRSAERWKDLTPRVVVP